MEMRLNHPNMLGSFEGESKRRVRLWGGCALGLWLALVGGDWGARFGVFRWQDQWLSHPAENQRDSGVESSVRSWEVPAQTGAGLTRMVPVPWIAARHAEFHPGYVEHRDGLGYHNEQGAGGTSYPVVMLGDSFLLSLGTQNVAQVLGQIGGIPVYNHGMYGAGPFLEMRKFLGQGRFDPLPRVVVWNLSARELGASLFSRQTVDAWFDHADDWGGARQGGEGVRIRWDELAPRQLRKSWPSTSLAAYFCRRVWGQIHLVVFRVWPKDVWGGDDPQFGPMLFYRENLRVLPTLTPEVDAPAVVRTARRVAERFRERGVTLVVLLVPEKEQIHVRALPAADQQALARGPEMLGVVEAGLKEAGVPVVNLMPVFEAATARGTRLYWRDDTHWNDAGIRLAAEELWRQVGPLLEGNRESMSNIQHPISNDQFSDR